MRIEFIHIPHAGFWIVKQTVSNGNMGYWRGRGINPFAFGLGHSDWSLSKDFAKRFSSEEEARAAFTAALLAS